jgi:hypothetical protein
MTRIQDDVKVTQSIIEEGISLDEHHEKIQRILDRLEKYEKVLNKIAMIGCSELAYSKEFTERVNQLVRNVLKEFNDE